MEMGLYLTLVWKAPCWPWGVAGFTSDSPSPIPTWGHTAPALLLCPGTFPSPPRAQLPLLLQEQTPTRLLFTLSRLPATPGIWGPRMLGMWAMRDTLLHHSPNKRHVLAALRNLPLFLPLKFGGSCYGEEVPAQALEGSGHPEPRGTAMPQKSKAMLPVTAVCRTLTGYMFSHLTLTTPSNLGAAVTPV